MLSRRRNRRYSDVRIDMTPMVDVMMLLVIFFMMSTVFVINNPGFAVQLPQAAAEKQRQESMTVMIGKNGQLALGGQPVDRHVLLARLKESAGQNTVITIQADQDVRHGQVVEVMDGIRRAGIGKMVIAVDDAGGYGHE